MTPVLLTLIFRLAACLIVAGAFCAVTWLLNLCGLCGTPSLQMFMAVAALAYATVEFRDTYLYIKDKRTIET